MAGLKNLLNPITIKSMKLLNRVVMAPMSTRLGHPDGTVSDALIAYLARRAKGGPGLIITEFVAVDPKGLAAPFQLRIYDDQFIPGLKKLVATAHEFGSKIAVQLHHAGRESRFLLGKGEAMGPSAIPSVVHKIAPRPMTLEDIGKVISAFGTAARRARETGFDAVEIHGGHGYLLTQFLSKLCNQRTDRYGGNLKNRARLIVDVIREVRKQVGDDFPISLRLSVEENIEDGYTAEDIQPALRDFEKAGADLIHASFGTQGSPGGSTCAPIECDPGFNAWRAQMVKDVVKVPVIAVGRFTDPEKADQTIGRGEADMVAFGRQFLADPDFLTKAKEGRFGDIRKCIACNQGCIERLKFGEGHIRCALNPETGLETIYPKIFSKEKRQVWVVGAGPGGLTAAYEAARLGHTVSLFEKENETGGQLRFASVPPYKDAYGNWVQWMTAQVRKMGVALYTNTPVTDEMVKGECPEAVILAIGGEKNFPLIEGIDRSFVCDAWQILSGEMPPFHHVLVIGAGLIGMETADFLCHRGCRVTLVDTLKASSVSDKAAHGYMLHNRLKASECKFYFNTSIKRVDEGGVTLISDGMERVLTPVEQVVVATGLKSRDALKATVQEMGIPHFIIGDAVEPRRIIEATDEGAQAAWNL